MSRTTDSRDYVEVKAKLPIRDKNGNDISADKMGPGGRRDENGCIIALAYDFEPLEETDTTKEQLQITDDGNWYLQVPPEGNDRQAIDDLFYCIEQLIDLRERHPEIFVMLKNRAIVFGRRVAGVFQAVKTNLTWKMPRVPLTLKLPRKTRKRKRIPASQKRIKSTQFLVKAEEKQRSQNAKEQEENITMSIEDAQLEVINLLTHYIEMKRSLQRLSQANAIEIQKLGFAGVIARLEGIIQQQPSLMDKRTEAKIMKFSLDDYERTRIKEILLLDSSD